MSTGDTCTRPSPDDIVTWDEPLRCGYCQRDIAAGTPLDWHYWIQDGEPFSDYRTVIHGGNAPNGANCP